MLNSRKYSSASTPQVIPATITVCTLRRDCKPDAFSDDFSKELLIVFQNKDARKV
jgi:hypothetical protein